jgi:hypothetical protein
VKYKINYEEKYLPSNAEKLCKIMKLPMNITTYSNRTSHRLKAGKRWKKKAS